MSVEKISWKTGEGATAKSGEFEVDFPDTLDACAEKFGDESVRLGMKKSWAIYLQAWARRQATKEEDAMTAEEIAEAAPGIRVTFSERESVDPLEKILAQFGKLSDEKRAALLASLKEMAA